MGFLAGCGPLGVSLRGELMNTTIHRDGDKVRLEGVFVLRR